MNEFQKLFESSRRTTKLLEGNDEVDVIDIGDAHWDAIETVQKAHPDISIEYDQQGGSAGDSYFNKFTIYNGSEELIGSVRVGDSSLSGMSEEEIKDYFVSALEDELKSVKSKKKKNKKARGVFVYDGTQEVPEDVTEVVVKEGVKEIGDEAFSYCLQLKSVTIPNSVTSIGYGAFIKCNRLTNITIPSSVTTIAPNAFVRCESLENITIPDSVTSIGKAAFSRCTGLKSITIPDSVTSIGAYAFSDCTSLTNITIPDGVTSIGKHAFNGCTGLTSITIGDSVTEIGSWAFYNCTGITSVTIPDSVTTIGEYAFSRCTGLTSVTIPDGAHIGQDAFYRTLLESQFDKAGNSNKAGKAKWPEELAFEDSYVGDQIGPLIDKALDKFNAWSEPSVQAGMGKDYIRSNEDDTVIAVIDYSTECEDLQDIYYASSSKSDCINKFVNYFKKKIDEYEPEIEESVSPKLEMALTEMPGTSTNKDLNTLGKSATSAAIAILENSGDITSNTDWDWIGASQLNWRRLDGSLIQVVIRGGATIVYNDTTKCAPVKVNVTGNVTTDATSIANIMRII